MDTEIKQEKKKKSAVKKIIIIIVDIAVIFLALYFVLGYFNFNKITKGEEPYLLNDQRNLKTEEGYEVDVYDFVIYKIIKAEGMNNNNESINTYKIKLWFMNDLD